MLKELLRQRPDLKDFYIDLACRFSIHWQRLAQNDPDSTDALGQISASFSPGCMAVIIPWTARSSTVLCTSQELAGTWESRQSSSGRN